MPKSPAQRILSILATLCVPVALASGPRALADDSGTGVSDPTVSLPYQDVAPVTPGGDSDPLSNIVRRVILRLGAGVILDPGPQIDQIVGDPWTLNPSTAEKLEHLPSKLRLQIYSALAANPQALVSAQPADVPGADPAGPARAPVVEVKPEMAKLFVNELGNRMGNYFSVEEMIDLGVYYLSRQPFFPKTQDGWQKVKEAVIHNDALLALGALLGEAAVNQGSFSLDGKLLKLDGDKFQVGWYGSIRDFGFKLQPTIREGLTLSTPHLEASAGLVHSINPNPRAESLGADFYVREHFIGSLTQPSGWDAGAYANTHVTILSGDPSQQGRVTTDYNLYVRKDHFAADPTLALLGSAELNTDYHGRTSGGANIGFEAPRWDFAAGANVSRIVDSGDPTRPTGWYAGVFFGGSFDSGRSIARGRMDSAARRVRDRLDREQREEQRLADIDAKLKKFGTGAYGQEEQNRLVHDWLMEQRTLGAARADLASTFKEYLEARTKFYVLEGRESRDALSDNDGPVPPETMASIRAALGDDPRYKNNGPSTGESQGAVQRAVASGGGASVVPKIADVPSVAPGLAGTPVAAAAR